MPVVRLTGIQHGVDRGQPDHIGRPPDVIPLRVGQNQELEAANAEAAHELGDAGFRRPLVDQHGALLRYSIAGGRIVAVHRVGRNWQGMGILTSPGDLTRDGRRDLVALRSDGTVWAYPHQGNARWGAVRQLGVGLTDVVGLA